MSRFRTNGKARMERRRGRFLGDEKTHAEARTSSAGAAFARPPLLPYRGTPLKGSNMKTEKRGVFAINGRNRQIEICSARIADVRERDRFIALLTRANELTVQAKNLRLMAWERYRTLTGIAKGERSLYA
jgi:hypothetical protein